jgi:hypothetical protein
MRGRAGAFCKKPYKAPSLRVYCNVVTITQASTHGVNVRYTIQPGNNNCPSDRKPHGVGAGEHYS